MRALVAEAPGRPLRLVTRPVPVPGAGEVLLSVRACGVCRTDLHVVDGDLPQTRYPVVPGHEVVGRVVSVGEGVTGLAPGDSVGVPWLGRTCGACRACLEGRENLCRSPEFTGCTRDGGFAETCVADARFCLPLPSGWDPAALAPLLCAGLIGYRAWRMAGPADRIGLYGFGASAHILCQVAVHEGQKVYAFTKPGDRRKQAFARSLGACWAGGSDEDPPELLDAAILFAPVGALVPRALGHVAPGGVVVAAGIHMSDIPSFPYRILWEERGIRSVANLTRRDGLEFFARVADIPLKTTVHRYPLERGAQALEDLRVGRFEGAAVLVPRPTGPGAGRQRPRPPRSPRPSGDTPHRSGVRRARRGRCGGS
ncbi:MAG: zinc-dependent alcohol dehydrogenase family protein [Deltaproteobacteria bacterium]|nr:zinc-dependent alcohol dehydrogenase family protein [Deltaproteobacteria bacterium]